MNNPLISIIVPVYNVKPYLNQCIDSIIKQTYDNLEIIIVNDGSDDGSDKICDEYKKKDKRIVVYHKQNGGLSDARNFALDKCNGEYITFIDSDDYVEKDYIEYLFYLIGSANAEISITEIKKFIDGQSCEKSIGYDKTCEKVLTAENAIRKMLMDDGFGHESCGKLFHRKLWKDIRFPKLLFEDYATTYYLFSKVEQCVYGKERKYYYRLRPRSIMTSDFNEKQLVLLDIADEVEKYLLPIFPESIQEIKRRHVISYCKVMKKILDSDERFSEIQNRIISSVRGDARIILKSDKIRNIDKLKVLALCLNKNLFYLFYKYGDKRNKKNGEIL